MTKNFDLFLKTVLESLWIISANEEHEKIFRDYIPEDKIKNAIEIYDWDLDLSDKGKLLKLLRDADTNQQYILTQAHPYMSRTNARRKGETEENINEKFKKDRERLMRLYSKFGFRHIGDGYMYRKPRNLNLEMTDGSVFGADGPYPTEDPRTPFVMGTYSRKGKVKTKKRRKRKKSR